MSSIPELQLALAVLWHISVLFLAGWLVTGLVAARRGDSQTNARSVSWLCALPVGVVLFTIYLFLARRWLMPGIANGLFWSVALLSLALWLARSRSGLCSLLATWHPSARSRTATVALASALISASVWAESHYAFTHGGMELMLHAGQTAALTRLGVPLREPFEPDHASAYRYADTLFASSFHTLGIPATTALAVSSGVVVAAYFLALLAGALAFLSSWRAAWVSALLGVFYSSPAWLFLALGGLITGSVPNLSPYFAGVQQQYLLSPRAGYSLMGSLHHKPSFPFSLLAWAVAAGVTVLLLAELRQSRRHLSRLGVALAAAGGICWSLAIAAGEYLLPSAAFALGVSGVALLWRRRYSWRPMAEAASAWVAAFVIGQFLMPTPIVSLTLEAETPVRMVLAARPGFIFVYGEEWVLGGRRFLADVGPFVLPALAVLVVARRHLGSDGVLLFWSGAVGAFLTAALFRLEPAPEAQNMFKFVAVGQMLSAPLLVPAALDVARLIRSRLTEGGLVPFDVAWRTASSTGAIASAGGILWAAQAIVNGASSSGVPPLYVGDTVLGRQLRTVPTWPRVIIIGGPQTHRDFKRTEGGASMPYLWAFGEAATPIGGIYGYPSYYEPAWRRASGQLSLDDLRYLKVTHLYVLPAFLEDQQVRALDALEAKGYLQQEGVYESDSPGQRRTLYKFTPR